MTKKEVKIEFAPGCFDNFDGTQEELDELIQEITKMAQSGELQERSRQIDLDDLDEDEIEMIEQLLMDEDVQKKGRNLQ